VGIALEQQERIFEHFYEVRDIERHSTSKTEFMGGGAGLGLSIARGVAEAHGGSLWAESEGYDPERCPGSKFHLILPLGEFH
jgi:signal transduction histidine kinase